jgi:hypothetical protein
MDASMSVFDWIAFATAALLLAAVLLRPTLEPAARRFAERTGPCMLALAALPVILRLALLHRHPIPAPAGADDFAYLLLADTLRHFRLANPAHPFRQFFEAVFILQEPTYSSIFPLGQGIVLAFGWFVFGEPWVGVVLSMAAVSALCYWMLRGWVSPGWALAGGILAAIQFGPLCQWMNLYWGGAVSAIAGCLVFGALPRLERERNRAAIILGAGLGLQLLTRPFEAVLLAIAVAIYVRRPTRALAIAALALVPAVALTLAQNHAVTRSWTTLPYQVSRYQYGVPTTFTVQAVPAPHRPLTPEQQLDYQAQSIIHGERETLATYFDRWAGRLPFYRFFFLPPLLLALPAFLLALREYRFAWAVVTLAIFSFGTNFYPYFYPHYIAAITSLFVLVSVVALQRISRLPHGRVAATLILTLSFAQFLFWYGVHAFASDKTLFALAATEKPNFINLGDPEGRIAVDRKLAQANGRHLVFVRYSPRHAFHEWIHNAADIDSARVVWAGDLGTEENDKLIRYYPDRRTWIVEPDTVPPRLYPYAARLITPAPAQPPVEPASVRPGPRPSLRLDDGGVSNPGGIHEVEKKPHSR